MRDVASMFAQQFKTSRVAHAEVQTAAAAEALQAAQAAADAGEMPAPPRSAFEAVAGVREQVTAGTGERGERMVEWLAAAVD